MGTSVSRPQGLTFMSVAGRVEGAATTLLAFDQDGRGPFVAAKVFRGNDGRVRASSEAGLLDELSTLPALTGSVPKTIFARELGGSWVLAQTVLPGRPMTGRVETAEREIELAFGWLERLQRASPPRHDPALQLAIEEELRTFQAWFELGPPERRLIDSIDVEAIVRCGAALEHGDFAPHNVLVAGGSNVGVIDWSDGTRMGVALHDAFFFITTISVLRASVEATYTAVIREFARAFRGPDRRPVERLRQLATTLGVGRDVLDSVFALFLVRVAVAEARRIRAAHERGSWSSFTLQVAAAEQIGPDRLPEAQPWIRFFRALAHDGPVFRT